MMPLFWLHWLPAPSKVSIDFDYIHLGSNPKLRLDVSYHTASLVSIGQSKLKFLSGN